MKLSELVLFLIPALREEGHINHPSIPYYSCLISHFKTFHLMHQLRSQITPDASQWLYFRDLKDRTNFTHLQHMQLGKDLTQLAPSNP